jgi:hypothetical protein
MEIDDWGVQRPVGLAAGPAGTVAATGGGAVLGAFSAIFFLAPAGALIGWAVADSPWTGAAVGVGLGAVIGAAAGASSS